ncbi:MAG: hypothetical protein CMK06_05625 [Ponticaulis sp.]|nr:hypothetical protein [Ponticaulis sp.]|tara:strand:- start:20674 stop:20874 length:201 start_codon:yes stop_codon:yes gene_type:complete
MNSKYKTMWRKIMSDMTLSGAHNVETAPPAPDQDVTWSDRATALFMIGASLGIWSLLGYVFHSRLN